MPGKQLTKIIQNLEKKKFREKYNLFKTEGEKLVSELLESPLHVRHLLASPAWIAEHEGKLPPCGAIETGPKEMAAISNFQSLPQVIALAEIPQYGYDAEEVGCSLSLLLNGIQDPGNLGTILRLADWFGIRHIFCDNGCAGAYNPKCVQASMGAIFRVQTHYTDLPALIAQTKGPDFSVFGTFLDGENVYSSDLPDHGFLIMGNEGKGISAELEALTDRRLTIPSFAPAGFSTESLNVGVAAGIVLSEFRRRTL